MFVSFQRFRAKERLLAVEENASTKNKNPYNLKLFKEFLAGDEEMRKWKKFLPPSSLCSVLERKMVNKTLLLLLLKRKLNVSSKI